MKAQELYEYIKAEAVVCAAKQKARVALKEQHDKLLNCYVSDENYDPKDASMVIFATLAAIICADDHVTVDEFMAMSSIVKGMEEKTIRQFVSDMKRINEKGFCRQKAINHINAVKCKSTAARYLHFCTTFALASGPINSEEEKFLIELCQNVLNRFRVRSYNEVAR